MVWRYAFGFFRILKLFFITGFLLQYLGNWYRTNGPLVNFTIFNTSNKNKAGDINSPWNLLVRLSFFQVWLVLEQISCRHNSSFRLFHWSFGNYAYLFYMIWRDACAFGVILPLSLFIFFSTLWCSLWAQVLLQFYTNLFQTLQVFLSWSWRYACAYGVILSSFLSFLSTFSTLFSQVW